MLVVIAELVFSLTIDDYITEIAIRTTLVSLSLTTKAMLSIQYGEHISQIDNSERGEACTPLFYQARKSRLCRCCAGSLMISYHNDNAESLYR